MLSGTHSSKKAPCSTVSMADYTPMLLHASVRLQSLNNLYMYIVLLQNKSHLADTIYARIQYITADKGLTDVWCKCLAQGHNAAK